jgi:hypothetical protein
MGFGLGLILGTVLSLGRQGANAAALASADRVMSLFASSGLDMSCCGCPPRCGASRMVLHPESAAAKARTEQKLNRFMARGKAISGSCA